MHRDAHPLGSTARGGWRGARVALAAALLASAAALSAPGGGPGPADAQPATTAWPMFQHDWDHSGRSPLLGPVFAGAPPLSSVAAWTGPDRIKTSPAIGADGTLYVGVGWSLCAIKPDMTTKWCERMGGDQSTSSPAIAADGTIYIGNRGNKLVAFADTTVNGVPTGVKLWEYLNGSEGDIFVSPTVGPDGTIYFALGQSFDGFGVVTALNPDGTLKWNFTIGSPVRDSSPAYRNGVIYIGSVDGNLHAFQDLGTHTERLWKTKVGGNVTASPVLAPDGTVYIAHNLGLSAVHPATGAIIWTFPAPAGASMTQTPALGSDGTIYVGSKQVKQKILWAVTPQGTEKWRYGPFDAEVDKAPMPVVGADGIIYVNIGPAVHAVTPAGGFLWSHPTSLGILAHPAIGGGATPGAGGTAILYVTSSDKKLRAISSHRNPTGGGGGNTPPTAVAGSDQSGAPGQVFTFDGSGSFDLDGDPLTYQWKFGDNQTASGPIVNHSYANPGSYTVTLTVNDGHVDRSDTLLASVTEPGGGTSFSDDFSRADSTTLGNGWTEAQGDLVIASHEMRNGPLAGTHMAVLPGYAGADQTVAADFAAGNNNAAPRFGVLLRFQNPQNHYVCYRHISSSGKLRISRVAGGVETVLGQFGLPNPPQNTFFRLECSVIGNSLVLSLNGVPKVTAVDATPLGSGKPGILIGTGASTSSVFRADKVNVTVN